MCGIAGVVDAETISVGRSELEMVRAMCDAMHHRGPDDSGFGHGSGFVLGMRRLAIIDVAHGQQPVHDESGRVTVVFNGEIYNFGGIQKDLRSSGHHLASNSDSECLPHLYEMHGGDMVDHLRGMFTIAVWDEERRSLLLARDRVGKKPLYYSQSGSRLWFASELKGLLAVPEVTRDLDPIAVDQYLTYQYVPHPLSIFKGIKKLPPGHRLLWTDGSVAVEPYWQLDYAEEGTRPPGTEEILAERLREVLLDATKVRMITERPLGAFLSGGLDSSAVVMARLSDQPISTFSIGFSDETYNELPFARQVAELYGTDHHELVVEPDIEDVLPKIARMFDEPFADSSAVPSYYLAEMARRDVVVVLNGDGGDESFGGYHRYAQFLKYGGGRRFPAPLVRAVVALGRLPARFLPSNHVAARLTRASSRLVEVDPATRYARMMSYFVPEEKAPLYRPEFAAELAGSDPYRLMQSAWAGAEATDVVNRLLACDLALYLPGDLLPKVDITTMSVSLEARSPLLDHRLMEWTASLPGDLKVRNGTTKYLFKKAMEPWLPDALIHRTKMGFGIPRNEWLQGPLSPMVNDLLLAHDSRVAAYLDPVGVQALVVRHAQAGDVGAQLWALLMLELWHREVAES
jgi:asparagine synthase (glutamine-hydrolysing)